MLLVSGLQLWWLNCKIKWKRAEMVKSGLKRGLIDERTVYLSQQLDGLLNTHMQKNLNYRPILVKQRITSIKIHNSLFKGLENALISLGIIVITSQFV